MDRRVQRVTHGSRCGQSINYQTSRSTWAFNHKNKVYRREINPSSHLLSVRRWIRRRNTFG